MGKNALTINVFEGLISAILIRIITPFWNSYASTLIDATLFGILNLIIWIILILIWRRIGYLGGLEWIMIKTVKKFSGKKSDHFNKDIKKTNVK